MIARMKDVMSHFVMLAGMSEGFVSGIESLWVHRDGRCAVVELVQAQGEGLQRWCSKTGEVIRKVKTPASKLAGAYRPDSH
jgi:hypothetical protein